MSLAFTAHTLSAIALALVTASPTAILQAQTTAPVGPPNADQGRATTTTVDGDEVDTLLAQLASDDWPTRTAAQDRLVAMGDAAEARISRTARESDDAEVRTRCETALQQIAENRLIGPTPITLRVHEVAPRVAFDEVARQMGIELKAQLPGPWGVQNLPSVTLDVQRESFWAVVQRLREQCGLDLEPSTGNALTVVATGARAAAGAGGPAGNPPTVTHGPFRLRATRVSRSYAVDLGSGGVAVNDFSVLLLCQAEPKLKISSSESGATVDVAEDENGLSLLPGEGGGGGAVELAPVPGRRVMPSSMRIGGGSAWPATARLAYPPQGAGKRIARLKGSVSCSVIVRSDTLEVPDILTVDGLTKDVGGTPVTIMSCRKSGERYELKVTLAHDPAGPAAVRQLRTPTQGQVRLVDSAGRDMMQQGSSTSMTKDGIDMTFRYFAAPLPAPAQTPATLIWQVPTDVRQMQIPFEFTDLPLP